MEQNVLFQTKVPILSLKSVGTHWNRTFWKHYKLKKNMFLQRNTLEKWIPHTWYQCTLEQNVFKSTQSGTSMFLQRKVPILTLESSTTWKKNLKSVQLRTKRFATKKSFLSQSKYFRTLPHQFTANFHLHLKNNENIYLFGLFPQTTGTIFTLWHFSLSPREHMSSVRLNTAYTGKVAFIMSGRVAMWLSQQLPGWEPFWWNDSWEDGTKTK